MKILKRFSEELEDSASTKMNLFMNKDMFFLNRDDSILEAIETFVANNADIILIGSKKFVDGYIEKQTIISKMDDLNYDSIVNKKIKDIMEKNLNFFSLNDSLEKIYSEMIQKKLRNVAIGKINTISGTIGYSEIFKALRTFSEKIENTPIISNFIEKQISFADFNSNIFDLIKTLKRNKTDYLIVKDNQKEKGIITLKDLLSAIRKGIDYEKNFAYSIMSPNIVYLNPGNSLNDALRVMLDRKFNQVPVQLDNKLSGIFTNFDLLNAYNDFILDLKKDVSKRDFEDYIKAIWEE
jgi:predicted transcriptional regulator